jgi:hypothetical protein
MAPAPPPALLDALLRLAPLDVLLFDTALVCRYAAPADGTLFGRTSDQLVGERAETLFPSGADDLLAALGRAAESAAGARYPSYRYSFQDVATTRLFCWSVRIEPVLLHDYRGIEEFHGVLVTLADVQDLADANERLQEENARLRDALSEARAREAGLLAARRRLRVEVRSRLAPVVGYLQALSRRPRILQGRTTSQLMEDQVLPGLYDVVSLVDGDPPTSGAADTGT